MRRSTKRRLSSCNAPPRVIVRGPTRDPPQRGPSRPSHTSGSHVADGAEPSAFAGAGVTLAAVALVAGTAVTLAAVALSGAGIAGAAPPRQAAARVRPAVARAIREWIRVLTQP